MSVRKVKGGYATVHCHKDKGKIITKFKTKEEALAQHRAIMAGKHHSADEGSFLTKLKSKFGVN